MTEPVIPIPGQYGGARPGSGRKKKTELSAPGDPYIMLAKAKAKHEIFKANLSRRLQMAKTPEKSTRLPKKEAVQPKKNGGARPGAGRKPFEPTDAERKQVEAMSGYGVPFEQIAALIREGICIDTLRDKFATELVNGKAKANAQIGKSIFQKARAGDTTAQIWWSKCQMGWKEPPRQLEHTGANGAPIAVATLDVSQLGTEVLAQIMAAKDATDAS